jgi:hypothetical protein
MGKWRCALAVASALFCLRCESDLDRRVVANEAAVERHMQALMATLECYRHAEGQYPEALTQLEQHLSDRCGTTDALGPALISIISKGSASGYAFRYRRLSDGKARFSLSAAPLEVNRTGRRFFLGDERGEVRQRTGEPVAPDPPTAQ